MSTRLPTTSSNERAPLLQHDSHDNRQHGNSRSWRNAVPFDITRIKITTLVPLLGLLTIFFNEAEFHIKGPAQLRATEALACYEYYAGLSDPLMDLGRSIPEVMCKKNVIQERVAALNGTYFVIRMICAVIGNLFLLSWFKAARRRPVLILHKLNLLCSNLLLLIAYFGYPRVPIWFITLTGASSVFGGNFDLGTSTLFAAYADIIPDATYRSNLIFVTTSLQYAAQAISLPLTGRLMNLDGKGSTPYVSFYVATACSVVVFLLNVLLFPETFKPEEHSDSRIEGTQIHYDGTDNSSAERAERDAQVDSSEPLAKKNSLGTENKSDNPFSVLWKEFGAARVILLLLATLCGIAGSRLIDMFGLLQYPSIKFKWAVAKTTYLICMQGVLSFVNFMIIIPTINKTCQRKFNITGRSMNVWITIVSAIIASGSAIGFGLPSTTPVVFVIMTATYTLGSGLCSALQAYTINIASSPRASGAALSVISLAATIGKVLASAIWPAAITIGLESPSGNLEGLPFFVAAVLFVLVGICIVLTDLTDKPRKVNSS